MLKVTGDTKEGNDIVNATKLNIINYTREYLCQHLFLYILMNMAHESGPATRTNPYAINNE